MSDLLAPLLAVMENEADAFWCFVGYMRMVVSGRGGVGVVRGGGGGGGRRKKRRGLHDMLYMCLCTWHHF